MCRPEDPPRPNARTLRRRRSPPSRRDADSSPRATPRSTPGRPLTPPSYARRLGSPCHPSTGTLPRDRNTSDHLRDPRASPNTLALETTSGSLSTAGSPRSDGPGANAWPDASVGSDAIGGSEAGARAAATAAAGATTGAGTTTGPGVGAGPEGTAGSEATAGGDAATSITSGVFPEPESRSVAEPLADAPRLLDATPSPRTTGGAGWSPDEFDDRTTPRRAGGPTGTIGSQWALPSCTAVISATFGSVTVVRRGARTHGDVAQCAHRVAGPSHSSSPAALCAGKRSVANGFTVVPQG